MSKKWQWYCDAGRSMHGLMVCVSCHKPITDGEYRCRETKDAYIAQHRVCSASDPMWVKLDSEREKLLVEERELHRDALAFVEKWGAVDLQDVIDSQPSGGDRHGE